MNRKIHHINKQFIELHVPSESTAFALQQRIELLTKETIPKLLESLFDSICVNDQYIIADKLEIDLGSIRFENFEAEFSRKLLESLRDRLSKNEIISDLGPVSASMHENDKPFIVKERKHLIESLIFFILNGYLQWNHIQFTDTDLGKLFEDSENDLDDQAVIQLKNFFQSSHRHIELFVNRFPAETTDKISRWLFPKMSNLTEAKLLLTEILSGINPALISGQKLTAVFLENVIQAEKRNIDQTEKLIADRIVELLISKYSKNAIADLLIAFDSAIKSLPQTSPKITFSFFSILINKLHKIFAGGATVYEKNKQAGPGYDSELTLTNTEIRQKESMHKSKPEKKPEEQNGIYISNAGLVLYHPFISEWFKSLNCVDADGNWLPNMQKRAVRLLQLLVNGEVNSVEYDLCLNKILCGLELDDEIDPEIFVTAGELESAGTLMNAVIRHWQALGESSVEALQETFIQRTGKLFFDQGNWQLHCEEKTVDILLNKLPWSFSIIKLPWMNQMLRVQWEIKSF